MAILELKDIFSQTLTREERIEIRNEYNRSLTTQTTFAPVITKSVTIAPTIIRDSPGAVASPIIKKEIKAESTVVPDVSIISERMEERMEERKQTGDGGNGLMSGLTDIIFLGGLIGLGVFLIKKSKVI
ncbi:hypothetical protein LCGC14_1236020 [marine sediment metagenome]|uniref:Uncharacterized protein n=1 Tax=marine sediment metagenome TaxID=412755 RepID=A0A0F9PBD8_9ZZZZ